MTEKYRNTPKGRIAPNGYRLCDPLLKGDTFVDIDKKTWVIDKPIGCGGFGEIYLCYRQDEGPSKTYVMKIDNLRGPLFVEVHFFLRACQKSTINEFMHTHRLSFLGIPRFIAHGIDNTRNGTLGYRFFVMERLGEELQKVLEVHRISIRVACNIATRILYALEFIHDQGYIHADIKAQNILRAVPSSSDGSSKRGKRSHEDSQANISEDDKYYLIDYGLAERFTIQGVHKPYESDKRKANNGTCEFRSRDAHIGVISRRSDIESLGFNIVLWFYGRHPWENMLNDADQVHEKKKWAMENIDNFLKEAFSDQPLPVVGKKSKNGKQTAGGATSVKQPSRPNIPLRTTPPAGLGAFFEEVNKMSHDSRPNYDRFRGILADIGSRNADQLPPRASTNGNKRKVTTQATVPETNVTKPLRSSKRLLDSAAKEELTNGDNDCQPSRPKRSSKTQSKQTMTNGTNGQSATPVRNGGKDLENESIEDDGTDIDEPDAASLPSNKKVPVRLDKSFEVKSRRKSAKTKLKGKMKNFVPKTRQVSRNTRLKSQERMTNGHEEQPKSKPLPSLVKLKTPKVSRQSTPLMLRTPPGGGTSPLFGPFEDSIKENRHSRNHNDSISSVLLDDDGEDGRYCRVYIDNHRSLPRRAAAADNDNVAVKNSVRKFSRPISTASKSIDTLSDDSFDRDVQNKVEPIPSANGKSARRVATSSSRSARKITHYNNDAQPVNGKLSNGHTPINNRSTNKVSSAEKKRIWDQAVSSVQGTLTPQMKIYLLKKQGLIQPNACPNPAAVTSAIADAAVAAAVNQ